MKQYYQMTGEETIMEVNGSLEPLTDEQVLEHQEKYGPNELVEGKKKESKPAPAAAAPAPVAAPVAEPAVEDVTDDGELIAVIAAAIAASEGKTSTDGFVVRSIRKVNRRKR